MAMTQNIFPPWGSFMSESRRFLRDEGFFPRRSLHGSDEGCGVGFRTLRPLPRQLLRWDVFFKEFIPPMFPFLPLSLSLFPFINSQNLSLFFIIFFFFFLLPLLLAFPLRRPPSPGFHGACDASIMVSSKHPLAPPSWGTSITDFWSYTKVESFY